MIRGYQHPWHSRARHLFCGLLVIGPKRGMIAFWFNQFLLIGGLFANFHQAVFLWSEGVLRWLSVFHFLVLI